MADLKLRGPRPSRSLTAAVTPLMALLGLCGLLLIVRFWSAGDSATPPTDGRSPALAESADEPAHPPTVLEAVDPRRLAGITDRTARLEHDPYFYLVDLARRHPGKLLADAARPAISFANLIQEPARYRGELVRLEGRIRRIARDPAPANEFGIESLYEGYLFTKDSGPRPCVVVTALPPRGLPVQAELNEPVITAGYFLKVWRHDTQLEHKVMQSPVFIAHRLERRATASNSVMGSLPIGVGIAILLLIVGGFLFAFWYLSLLRPESVGARGNDEPIEFTDAPPSAPSVVSAVPPMLGNNVDDTPP